MLEYERVKETTKRVSKMKENSQTCDENHKYVEIISL